LSDPKKPVVAKPDATAVGRESMAQFLRRFLDAEYAHTGEGGFPLREPKLSTQEQMLMSIARLFGNPPALSESRYDGPGHYLPPDAFAPQGRVHLSANRFEEDKKARMALGTGIDSNPNYVAVPGTDSSNVLAHELGHWNDRGENPRGDAGAEERARDFSIILLRMLADSTQKRAGGKPR